MNELLDVVFAAGPQWMIDTFCFCFLFAILFLFIVIAFSILMLTGALVKLLATGFPK